MPSNSGRRAVSRGFSKRFLAKRHKNLSKNKKIWRESKILCAGRSSWRSNGHGFSRLEWARWRVYTCTVHSPDFSSQAGGTLFPTDRLSLAVSQRACFVGVGVPASPFRATARTPTARARTRARMYPVHNPQMVPPSGMVTGMPLQLIICPTCRATVQPPPGAPVVACGVCGATMHVAPAFPPPPPVVLKSRPSGSCFWMPCLIAFAWVSDAGETLARVVGALFCCCLGLDMLE